jgi:hypothetical protein
MPEAMGTTRADLGKLVPCDLAAVMDLLQHTAPLAVAAAVPTTQPVISAPNNP